MTPGGGRSANTTKVFVGSLPSGVTAADLRKLFEPYGYIAECDIANRCGFLHLRDQELALKAIEELNGIDFMGGKISVEKGRVKPRRGPGGGGGGGPMRGGKDRGGPYSRGGGDFRGPPRNGGFGLGGGRDAPPFRGGGDRFGGGGYDRPPQRGGYGGLGGGGGGGFGGPDDRRGGGPPLGGFEDRRGGGGGGGGGGFPDRFGPGYNDRRPYDDRSAAGGYDGPMGGGGFDERRAAPGGYEDRRPNMGERRPMMDAPARGTSGGDLFSRRDTMGPKPAGVYGDRPNSYGAGGGANGYGGGSSAPYGGGGGGATSYGDRGGYGAGGGGAYGAGAGGGYGDSYSGGGAPTGARGGYDSAYPPLPAQRGFASGGGGGPGSRRDMPPERRF